MEKHLKTLIFRISNATGSFFLFGLCSFSFLVLGAALHASELKYIHSPLLVTESEKTTEEPKAQDKEPAKLFPTSRFLNEQRKGAVEPQTLFDGEHAKPYQGPLNYNPPHFLGSWNIEGRTAFLTSTESGEKEGDAFSAYVRFRFGPLGSDLSFTSLDLEEQPFERLITFRSLLDLDIYQWLTLRGTLGYAGLDFDHRVKDSHGVTLGAEVELYPYKPFTIDLSIQGISTSEVDPLFDAFIGVGFIPTLVNDSSEPTRFFPEFKLGWRRFIGPRGSVNINFFEIQLAFEF